jgi:hypothetical protein
MDSELTVVGACTKSSNIAILFYAEYKCPGVCPGDVCGVKLLATTKKLGAVYASSVDEMTDMGPSSGSRKLLAVNQVLRKGKKYVRSNFNSASTVPQKYQGMVKSTHHF